MEPANNSLILRPATQAETPLSQRRFLLVLVLLMLAIISLHSYRFSDINYRHDEINTVHAANVLSYQETVQWLGIEGTHPPGWRAVAIAWVRAFGEWERITRFQSSLFTLLALALIYRLARDLFDSQVGLMAVLVTGVLPFTLWHSHEFRPYAALLTLSAAQLLVYLRWLRHRDFKHSLLYVLIGVAAMYTHYFAAFVVLAQAIFTFVAIKWNPGIHWRALGLAFAIGASFATWIPTVIYATFIARDSGVSYAYATDFEGLRLAILDIQGLPVLLLPALLLPVGQILLYRKAQTSAFDELFRWPTEWRRWYLIIVIAAMLGMIVILNIWVGLLVVRNLIIAIPGLAVLAGYLFRGFRLQVRLTIVVILAGLGVFVFHPYFHNIPYRQMATYIDYEDGDRIVTNINRGNVGTTVLVYYLLDFLPNDPAMNEFYSIIEQDVSEFYYHNSDPLVNLGFDDDPETKQQFESFLSGADRVWYVEYYGAPLYEDRPLTEPFIDVLKGRYRAVASQIFTVKSREHEQEDRGYYTVVEYRAKEE